MAMSIPQSRLFSELENLRDDAIIYVQIVTIRVLQSHHIIRVDDYDRGDCAPPMKLICDFLLLEIYSAPSLRPRNYVSYDYPREPTLRDHRDFLRRRFEEIYNMFYMTSAKQVAFMAVWAYAVETMLHTAELGLHVSYIRHTATYLARFFSGEEFTELCSFPKLVKYARLNVESESGGGGVVRVEQFLRRHILNRYKVKIWFRRDFIIDLVEYDRNGEIERHNVHHRFLYASNSIF